MESILELLKYLILNYYHITWIMIGMVLFSVLMFMLSAISFFQNNVIVATIGSILTVFYAVFSSITKIFVNLWMILSVIKIFTMIMQSSNI